MKIDKAIEILTDHYHDYEKHLLSGQRDALKLGIEALKLVDNLRFDGSPYYPNLLPGETEE